MNNREDRWNFVLYSENLGASGYRISIAGYGDEGEYSGIYLMLSKHKDYGSRQRGVMESVYKNNLIQTTGICWVCGETHPRVLERHHLYERKGLNTLRTDYVCGICANCHRKRKVTGGETERHQIAILNAIEREWFGLGGD